MKKAKFLWGAILTLCLVSPTWSADDQAITGLQTDVNVTKNKAEENANAIKGLAGGLPALEERVTVLENIAPIPGPPGPQGEPGVDGTAQKINMDQYEQTVTYKVFKSTNSSNSYDTLTTLREPLGPDTFSSTWTFGDSKVEYIYVVRADGRYRIGDKSYRLDPATQEYVLNYTRTVNPPFKFWPKGEILPYQTWGGIFTVSYDYPPELEPYNRWRDYSIVGYEDVTVPYGTFENALKVKRLRINGGYSYYWYVPEVGRVKEENIYSNSGYMEILELIDAY